MTDQQVRTAWESAVKAKVNLQSYERAWRTGIEEAMLAETTIGQVFAQLRTENEINEAFVTIIQLPWHQEEYGTDEDNAGHVLLKELVLEAQKDELVAEFKRILRDMNPELNEKALSWFESKVAVSECALD